MASIYKRTHRKPVPDGAEVGRQMKPIPSGAVIDGDVVTWTDRSGCKRTAARDGTRIISKTATWTDARGNNKSAPIDHSSDSILLVDQFWMGSYTDDRGRRVRKSTRTTDKAAAQRVANKWEADAQLRSEGVIDAVDESLAKHSAMPIGDQVDAFLAFRATKGGTEMHRNRTRKHIEEFITAGGWETIGDINSDDVALHIGSKRQANASARTIQGRLQSIKSFTKWLADQHRLRVNPLSMVSKPDPNADRRHERRMLLPDEWPWLMSAVESSKETLNGLEPNERLLLYRTAIQTGLRSGELCALTRGRLILGGAHPHILCKAAGTKNRKPAKQYIDKPLASALGAHVGRKHPTAPVFSVANKDELARTIQADLSDARRLWLKSLPPRERIEQESSDFLCELNHEGEHFVFHSLRHTTGAWLALAEEHPKTIQTVMRHGSITLTMDTYGHLFPGQAEGAVLKLSAMMTQSKSQMVPNLSPQAV